MRPSAADPPNDQTLGIFDGERATIAAVTLPLTWLRPSDQDADRVPMAEAIAADTGDAPEMESPVGAGRVRGLLLHMLSEEVLTG
jgi:hypothetical protein